MFKRDFPIFKSKMVYLDSAASTQKPKCVLDSMNEFYTTSYSNVHRGTCHLANAATTAYENARQTVATFLNTKSENIIFTKGTTEGINLVASSYAETLTKNDEVLISIAEHHANFVPWQQACLRSGAKLKVFNILPDGRWDLDDFKSKLTSKTKIVAVAVMSNVLGVINPVEKVIQSAHKAGALVLLDGAQSVAHMATDVAKLDCDFFVFSGHKIYGPTGIGVLYGKAEVLNKLVPYQYGGEMIDKVTVEKTTFAPIPARFEAGTPPIVEAIGLAESIRYVNKIGFDTLQNKENALYSKLIDGITKIDGIEFVGDPKYKSGLVSFNIKGIHPNDLGIILAQENICVRIGHHCAMPVHDYYGIKASLRVSLGLYNDENDIRKFIIGLKKAKDFFNG